MFRALKYEAKEPELFLAWLLFCLFADDSGVFDKDELLLYVRTKTAADSDPVAKLNELFEVLDTPEERRSSALDEDVARFPYVNGRLFHERLSVAHFDAEARVAFIQRCEFDWSGVSPIISTPL